MDKTSRPRNSSPDFLDGMVSARLRGGAIRYALARGLACRNLVGNQDILNRDRRLKARRGIAKKERIFGCMGLGYAAVKFKNKVTGKKMRLSWNGT